eukprot:12797479-Prorocentrum_lima.AAC.1
MEKKGNAKAKVCPDPKAKASIFAAFAKGSASNAEEVLTPGYAASAQTLPEAASSASVSGTATARLLAPEAASSALASGTDQLLVPEAESSAVASSAAVSAVAATCDGQAH